MITYLMSSNRSSVKSDENQWYSVISDEGHCKENDVIWCEWSPLFSNVWNTVSTMPFEWWESLSHPIFHWRWVSSCELELLFNSQTFVVLQFFWLINSILFSSKKGHRVPSWGFFEIFPKGICEFYNTCKKNLGKVMTPRGFCTRNHTRMRSDQQLTYGKLAVSTFPYLYKRPIFKATASFWC